MRGIITLNFNHLLRFVFYGLLLHNMLTFVLENKTASSDGGWRKLLLFFTFVKGKFIILLFYLILGFTEMKVEVKHKI